MRLGGGLQLKVLGMGQEASSEFGGGCVARGRGRWVHD